MKLYNDFGQPLKKQWTCDDYIRILFSEDTEAENYADLTIEDGYYEIAGEMTDEQYIAVCKYAEEVLIDVRNAEAYAYEIERTERMLSYDY